MKLTITGRVISKKNSKRVFRNHGKTIVISSKAYMEFEKEALTQIKKQNRKFKPIVEDVFIDYTFLLKGKGRVDCDNLIASVNDVLQKAGVIADDDQVVGITARKYRGQPEYVTEVNILLGGVSI